MLIELRVLEGKNSRCPLDGYQPLVKQAINSKVKSGAECIMECNRNPKKGHLREPGITWSGMKTLVTNLNGGSRFNTLLSCKNIHETSFSVITHL